MLYRLNTPGSQIPNSCDFFFAGIICGKVLVYESRGGSLNSARQELAGITAVKKA